MQFGKMFEHNTRDMRRVQKRETIHPLALVLLLLTQMLVIRAEAFGVEKTFMQTGKYKYSESESLASMRAHVKETIIQAVLQTEVGGYSESMLNIERQESASDGGVRSSSTQSITQILAGHTKYRVVKEWTDEVYFNTTAEVTVDIDATKQKLNEIAANRKRAEEAKSAIAQQKQDAMVQQNAALVAQNKMLQQQAELEKERALLAEQQAVLERERVKTEQSIADQKRLIAQQASLNEQTKVLAEQLAKVGVTSSSTLPGVTPIAGIPDNFVLIRGGTFTMGSPARESERWDDEGPRHQVRVSDFYMGKYEVTQAEWEAVMGTNPSYFKGSNLPVESVSWNDCQAFIAALNRKTAKTYRLPTEAEWEYACRAGTTTPFSTGRNLTTEQANYDGNWPYNGNAKGMYRHTSVPVDSFAPNAWGLYNMHGNVWEWCSDWYGSNYYSNRAVTNPQGPSTGSCRVIRGGCCYSFAWRCRSASRLSHAPDDRNYIVGFRLVFVP